MTTTFLAVVAVDSSLAPVESALGRLSQLVPFEPTRTVTRHCNPTSGHSHVFAAWSNDEPLLGASSIVTEGDFSSVVSGYGFERGSDRGLRDCLTPEVDLARLWQAMDGEWSALTCGPQGLRAASSATGTEHIYYTQHSNWVAVSNRARLLWGVRTLMDARVELDSQVIATLATKTYPFCTDRTAVREISLLHASKLLSVTDGREVELTPLDSAFFLDRESAQHVQWSDLSELLLHNVSWLRGKNSRLVAALTGGKDSRLVLASLVRSNQQDRVNFYIRAPEHHADTRVARRLADKFDLQFSVKTRPLSEDFFADVEQHVLTTEGLLNLWDLKLGPDEDPYIGIHGLLGEVYRSQAKTDSNDRAKNTAILFSDDPFSIRTPSQEHVESKWITSWVSEQLSQGVEPCELSDIFYLDQRIRRWMGQAKLADGTWGVHFNPLFSRDILRRYYTLPLPDRARERIHFELMLQLEPELARLPFARASWNPELLHSPNNSEMSFDTTKVDHSAPVVGSGWQVPIVESNWSEIRERILDSHRWWEESFDRNRVEALLDVVAASLGLVGPRRTLKSTLRHPVLTAKVRSDPKASLQRVFGLLTGATFADAIARELS